MTKPMTIVMNTVINQSKDEFIRAGQIETGSNENESHCEGRLISSSRATAIAR